MSAYITDKAVVDEMVNLAIQHRVSFYDNLYSAERETVLLSPLTQHDEIGQHLVDAMVKSVGYRYSDDRLTGLPGPRNAYWVIPYKLENMTARRATPIEGIKLTQCYDYQTCEHPDYRLSSVKHFVDMLIHGLIARLPGYDEADWGWSEPTYRSSVRRIV